MRTYGLSITVLLIGMALDAEPMEATSARAAFNPRGVNTPAESMTFIFTVSPISITDVNSDIPKLDGDNVTAPPGGSHPKTGGPLLGGADKRWDVSRQFSFKISNPDEIVRNLFSTGYGTLFDSQPLVETQVVQFPSDEVKGNDDALVGDTEENDPYTSSEENGEAIGNLVSFDRPVLTMPDLGIKDENTTIEILANFREFARLNLGDDDNGGWYIVSDYIDWHLLLKIKANSQSEWTDDGSSGGAGHQGTSEKRLLSAGGDSKPAFQN